MLLINKQSLGENSTEFFCGECKKTGIPELTWSIRLCIKIFNKNDVSLGTCSLPLTLYKQRFRMVNYSNDNAIR